MLLFKEIRFDLILAYAYRCMRACISFYTYACLAVALFFQTFVTVGFVCVASCDFEVIMLEGKRIVGIELISVCVRQATMVFWTSGGIYLLLKTGKICARGAVWYPGQTVCLHSFALWLRLMLRCRPQVRFSNVCPTPNILPCQAICSRFVQKVNGLQAC